MSNSIPDGLDVLAVEPNIEKHSEFDVINYIQGSIRTGGYCDVFGGA